MMLFTDGSLDPKTRVGFGAYLFFSDTEEPLIVSKNLSNHLKIKQFENTSSTALELQTLLWALNDPIFLTRHREKLRVYTDSQNIVELPTRKNHLIDNSYCSSGGKLLNNARLYQEFFGVIEGADIQLIKIKGHKSRQAKDHVDRLFSLVDKAARAALREFNK